MAAVVAQSVLFTPADIEFAARRTAQLVFEGVLFEHQEEQAATADVLRGIAETRRNLTQPMVADFEQDIADFARAEQPFAAELPKPADLVANACHFAGRLLAAQVNSAGTCSRRPRRFPAKAKSIRQPRRAARRA